MSITKLAKLSVIAVALIGTSACSHVAQSAKASGSQAEAVALGSWYVTGSREMQLYTACMNDQNNAMMSRLTRNVHCKEFVRKTANRGGYEPIDAPAPAASEPK